MNGIQLYKTITKKNAIKSNGLLYLAVTSIRSIYKNVEVWIGHTIYESLVKI